MRGFRYATPPSNSRYLHRLPPGGGARFGVAQQVVRPVLLEAVLAEPEEVLLRKLEVLAVHAHIERSAAHAIDVEGCGAA